MLAAEPSENTDAGRPRKQAHTIHMYAVYQQEQISHKSRDRRRRHPPEKQKVIGGRRFFVFSKSLAGSEPKMTTIRDISGFFVTLTGQIDSGEVCFHHRVVSGCPLTAFEASSSMRSRHLLSSTHLCSSKVLTISFVGMNFRMEVIGACLR